MQQADQKVAYQAARCATPHHYHKDTDPVDEEVTPHADPHVRVRSVNGMSQLPLQVRGSIPRNLHLIQKKRRLHRQGELVPLHPP